jgi:hypothetical protein
MLFIFNGALLVVRFCNDWLSCSWTSALWDLPVSGFLLALLLRSAAEAFHRMGVSLHLVRVWCHASVDSGPSGFHQHYGPLRTSTTSYIQCLHLHFAVRSLSPPMMDLLSLSWTMLCVLYRRCRNIWAPPIPHESYMGWNGAPFLPDCSVLLFLLVKPPHCAADSPWTEASFCSSQWEIEEKPLWT